MRQYRFVIVLLAMSAFASGGADAADLPIPPRPATPDVSIQKGPPNCRSWTDQCVKCSRSGDGEPSTCSNIGFACQPQAIRCLSASPPKP